MKMNVIYFMLFVATASCASSAIKTTDTIKSWMEVDPAALNNKIRMAYDSGQPWVTKPQLYVFNLFYFDEIKKFSYEYGVDNTEDPRNINISVSRDGFLDDSVRGDIHQLQLIKNKAGQWEILSIKKVHSCWRTEHFIYSTDACP